MAEYQTTLTLDLPGSTDDFILSVRRRWPSRADGNSGLRLFISHASEDKNVCEMLCEALRLYGVTCFTCENDISAGSRWPEIIEDELNSCDALVYLSSEHSNSSMWCQQEAAWARGRGVPVLPLPLDDSEMCGALAVLQQLPAPENLVLWERKDEKYRSRVASLRNRAKTVAEIFKELAGADDVLKEDIIDLVLKALEHAKYLHEVTCAKDVLEELPTMSETQLARVEAACDNNKAIQEAYGGGVENDLRSLIKKQRTTE